jgi:hypothetical protein
MSYMTSALVPCQTLQADLAAVWQEEIANGADEMTPLEDVLMSAANNRQISQLMSPGGGNKRTVELKYTPRLLESDVQDNYAVPTCTSTNKSGEFSSTYDMPDTYIGADENFEAEDFTNWCGDNGQRFTSRLAAMADAIERKVATQHADEFALLAGNWGTGLFTTGNAVGNVNTSNEYVMATLLSGGTAADPTGLTKLRIARMKAGLMDTVGIGGTTMWEYMERLAQGCCANSGDDLTAAINRNGLNYAYDSRLEDALGSANKFMLYRLGSVVPLFYTRNRWADGFQPQVGSNYLKTVINGPRYGTPMDLTITDDCASGISVILTVSTKLIAVPNDQFQTGDKYFGRNGVAKVLITNPS